MSVSRRTLALALALTPGIGGKTVTRTMTRNDLLGRKPEEFLALGAEALREDYGFTASAAAAWAASPSGWIEKANALQATIDPLGVSMMTAADAHYPRRLEEFDADPPGILFLYGNTRLLEAQTFAIPASRKAPPEALDLMDRWAEEGILAGEVLVSSHDTPEYQRTAVVPLRWGAPRVLVLDQGLFTALGEDLQEEPFAAARLWRYKFDPGTDLAISCLRPNQAYLPSSNQTRDKIVFALSLRIALAHVKPGGNMARLAMAAIRAGRQVEVAPNCAAGTVLIEAGARVRQPAV